MNRGEGTYGVECDWWALGCVMWEILFGATPFYDDMVLETYRKINSHVLNQVRRTIKGKTNRSEGILASTGLS